MKPLRGPGPDGGAGDARRARRRRSARDIDADADVFATATEALAVLLDAGIAPSSAWRHVGATTSHPRIRRIASLVEAGRPVEDAVVAEALASPGDDGLTALAAAWLVASSAGSPMSTALRGAASALRDRADIAREVDVALSGPRSTARFIAWLPAVGIGFALLLGVDVVGVLTGSPVGLVLLVLGASLAFAGRAWTGAMVRRATPDGAVPGWGEELLVSALRAGLSIDRAQRLVADAERRLGAQPSDGREIGSVLDLSARSGAPAAELLASSAAQRRRAARASGRRGAAELGVRLLLPLTLCVLPSFLLLGVAPVVLGLISSTAVGF